MNKNIQQLAAMVGVLRESVKNKDMKEVISVYISSHFETTIHITEELFFSLFNEYEKGEHTNETDEVYVSVEGVKVFALIDVEDDQHVQ